MLRTTYTNATLPSYTVVAPTQSLLVTVTFYPDPPASLPTSDTSSRRTAPPRWSLSQMLAVATRVLAPALHHLHLTLLLTYESYLLPHYMHTFGATTTRSETLNTLNCTYTPP